MSKIKEEKKESKMTNTNSPVHHPELSTFFIAFLFIFILLSSLSIFLIPCLWILFEYFFSAEAKPKGRFCLSEDEYIEVTKYKEKIQGAKATINAMLNEAREKGYRKRNDGKFDGRNKRGKEINRAIPKENLKIAEATSSMNRVLQKPKHRYNGWLFPHLAKWSTRMTFLAWGVLLIADFILLEQKLFKIITFQSLDSFREEAIALAMLSTLVLFFSYTILYSRTKEYYPASFEVLFEEARAKYGKTTSDTEVSAELIVEVVSMAFSAFKKVGHFLKKRQKSKKES